MWWMAAAIGDRKGATVDAAVARRRARRVVRAEARGGDVLVASQVRRRGGAHTIFAIDH